VTNHTSYGQRALITDNNFVEVLKLLSKAIKQTIHLLIIQASDADTRRFSLRITQLTNLQVDDVTKLTASRDNTVGIATGRRTERSGVRISAAARDVFLPQPPI